MAKYLRSIQAGRWRYDYTYSKVNRRDCDKARAEKAKASSKAQKTVNDKLSRLQLTGILAANFTDRKSAMFVTLTFDEDHYPTAARKSQRRKQVEKEAVNYIDRLGYLARNRKKKFRRVWFIGLGEQGRYHIHVVVDGLTGEDVRDCWGRGNVDYHHLYDKKWLKERDWYSKKFRGANPVQIAKYAMQNANERPTGKHPWHASRNCQRPTSAPARLIADGVSIDPPDSCELLDKTETNTIYSQCAAVEYILPFAPSCSGRSRKPKSGQQRR